MAIIKSLWIYFNRFWRTCFWWLIKEGRKAYFKVAFLILFLGLVFFLIGKYVFSRKVVTYSFVNDLPGAENFLSLNKDGGKLEIGGIILKNKVTRFSLENSKNLGQIGIHFAFKPGQKEIKLGIRGDESEDFHYKSLYFDPLNSLNWDKIEEGGVTLYQKTKTFDSISAFINQIPKSRVATYQVDVDQLIPYVLNKLSGPNKNNISVSIRGDADLYILNKGGDLNIQVQKQDLNMYEGVDILKMSLFSSGMKVAETSIQDDGFGDKSKSQTVAQNGNISISGAKAGIYKLELRFDSPNNDSVIKQIEINQSKAVFGGSVLVWDSSPINFYSQGDKIEADTSWAESIQNLKVDDKADLAIKETKNKYSFDLKKIIKNKNEDELYKIYSPKGKINFGSNSYFSFSPESYFNPEIIKAQQLSLKNEESEIENNFDFVLTSMNPVKEVDYWLVSDLKLWASDYQLKGKKIYFSLEIPDLDKRGGSLEVGALSVTLNNK